MEELDYPTTEEPNSPQYNASFDTLNRIHMWCNQANLAQRENNPTEWRTAVLIIYKEVSAYLDKRNVEYHDKRMEQIEKAYGEYISYVLNYQENVKHTNNVGRFQPPREIFDQLYKWEREIRREDYVKKLLLKQGEGVTGAAL